MVRLLRELGLNRDALELSRAAEAEAAAEAERARLAREMHDVLAHSLSALALQLESTRLLAIKHGIESEVTRAIDRAHQIAATGLHEARSAVATARGDELPGPDGIAALVDAFAQQSGLSVDLAVQGEPRALAPDAGFAVYRTVQEALTNIRRHATPERVTIELSYLRNNTVLVVEDRATTETPPPAPVALNGGGYGLTGMRERAELLDGELTAEPTKERLPRRTPAARMNDQPIRVILADDQRLVRESLGTLLDLLDGIDLVASAADGQEALDLVELHRPDVVLMDIRMPHLDGIEATRQLHERHPDARVIALTTYADDQSVLGALRAGARGYLTKDASSAQIRGAILAVAAGDAALDPAVQHHVVAALADDAGRMPLPRRQSFPPASHPARPKCSH